MFHFWHLCDVWKVLSFTGCLCEVFANYNAKAMLQLQTLVLIEFFSINTISSLSSCIMGNGVSPAHPPCLLFSCCNYVVCFDAQRGWSTAYSSHWHQGSSLLWSPDAYFLISTCSSSAKERPLCQMGQYYVEGWILFTGVLISAHQIIQKKLKLGDS